MASAVTRLAKTLASQGDRAQLLQTPDRLLRLQLLVSPGLERMLQRELEALQICKASETGPGSLDVEASEETLWQVVLRSRIAEQVRIRLGDGSFWAGDEQKLRKVARELPWFQYIPLGIHRPLPKIKVVSRDSRLFHTGLIEDRVREALVDRAKAELSERPDDLSKNQQKRGVGKVPPPSVHVSMLNDQCNISINASGDLSKRVWRVATGATPLRENLAAAVLLKTPLLQLLSKPEGLAIWDPFCGTGALLLEALGIAMGVPPGSPHIRYPFREFPIHRWQKFEKSANKIRLLAHPNVSKLKLLGSDIDALQIKRAEKNLKAFKERTPRAAVVREPSELRGDLGLEEEEEDGEEEEEEEDEGASGEATTAEIPARVSFVTGDFQRFVPHVKDCLVITNVPYGRRTVGEGALKRTYRAFGRALLRRRDWKGVYVVSANREFARHTGLAWKTELQFSNGGIKCDLLSWTGQRSKSSYKDRQGDDFDDSDEEL
uniref:Uncharacterized protein n=1 Tax=Chromera velia CCMP2878 TaxID=1169474 RepID=A0A0G4I8Y7_9ALVE|eukprot:Cvel_12089.t1-p1 / transcript=Cvel_12089.t1 / gene=Cvel_12089 / organism=Chromera_velia_CCMP2878 / gene_product=Ribosomal RNA large subunit methyltransferase K/L, putative / transcript_product=Ribosomal RNA large subunit methyltransferase K/L, putative / location=Cvel_scaffold778:42365-50214(-) / protein_length=490 / sequence_SO=supercontig / SO=protein_coding / is_pseudo=false